MKTRESRYFCWFPALLCLMPSVVFAAKAVVSDVFPTAKRRPTVELAQRLAAVTPPPPLPPETVLPFNPVAFSQPDPEEQRALEQAAASQQALVSAPSANSSQARPGATDREQLVAIASRIMPKGTIFIGNEAMLSIGNQFIKIGAKFTVSYLDVDYILELTAIDRTTFTLRLNGEQITRPIKSAK